LSAHHFINSIIMNWNEYFSVDWCKQNYGHYALFATLRLHTAVMHHDDYDLSRFDRAFRRSGKDHEVDPHMRDFMKNLIYPDSHHFTTDELRFYIQAASPYRDLTDEQIENELEAIERDRESDVILDCHAEYLVKAIEYWRLHFKEKFEKWRQEFSEANTGWILRRKLAEGDIMQEEGIITEDDGYYSSEDENEEDEGD
jgi:hypothetical protein